MQNMKYDNKAAKRKRLDFFPGMLLFIVYLLFSAFSNIYAQAPEQFPYQAMIRDGAGDVLKGIPVDIRVQLLQDTTMNVIYSETHKDTTNAFGLVTLEIGAGDSLKGSFDDINWKKGNIYIDIGLKDENDYLNMGTAQLLSVPYALYAKTAIDVNDNDTSVNNELQNIQLSGDTLLISGVKSAINLAQFRDGVNDADSVTGNEWIDSITVEGNYLVLYEGGQTISLEISDIQNDADSVVGNELIVTNGVVFEDDTLKIIEADSANIKKISLAVLDQSNMSVKDQDHDPINEIQYFKRKNNMLYLTYKSGVSTSDTVDLSIYDKDEQTLSVTVNGDTVILAIDRGDTVSFSIADVDHNDTNEIQNLYEVLDFNNNAGNEVIAGLNMPVDDGDAASVGYVDSIRTELEEVFTDANLYDFLTNDNADTVELIYFGAIGLLKDNRDNQIYRIQKIGNTWWMLDDLDYEGTNELGYYYEDTSEPTDRHYGKYYTSNELENYNVCPDGWEVADTMDYFYLHQSYNGQELLVGGNSDLDLVIAGVYVGIASSWFDGDVYYWTNDGSQYVHYNLDLNDYSYSFNNIGSSSRMRVRCVKE